MVFFGLNLSTNAWYSSDSSPASAADIPASNASAANAATSGISVSGVSGFDLGSPLFGLFSPKASAKAAGSSKIMVSASNPARARSMPSALISPNSSASISVSQPDCSASRLSARIYARRCASVRCSTSTHGTSVMPSACAASTRPWPAMIFRSLSISTGLTKPNSRRLALICAIWLSLCVLAFRA